MKNIITDRFLTTKEIVVLKGGQVFQPDKYFTLPLRTGGGG